MKNILVTCALPYSNGPIHLGHVLEHIQADIWVKYQRFFLGNNVYFICADDSHGTAIMLKSIELNIDPLLIIKKNLLEHKKIFKKFNILHDIYFTTHSKENYYFSLLLMNKIKSKNLLIKKNIMQYYDSNKNIFLPDRYIKGICPICKAKDQYGDYCNICNNIYYSYDLINPISLLSNEKPILKKSEHLFLKINSFKKKIEKWISLCFLQNEVKNQLLFLLKNKLIDWNISRDLPYFGFKIPNKFIKKKYFYVWFDALICYISTFNYFCKINNFSFFNKFWKNNNNYYLYNFIGKDILYFHGLLWPIILDILNFKKPTGLVVHGHILVNGKKMSKSLNNFISAKDWLDILDSDSLRYYLSTKLSFKINDINLCLNDFIKTINSEIVNKFINIPSRICKFLENYFDNILSNEIYNINFYYYFVNKFNLISDYYLNFNYKNVLYEINNMIDLLNKFINDMQPWLLIHSKKKFKKLHSIFTTIINIFKIISVYLYPIIPNLFFKIQKFLKIKLNIKNFHIPILNHKISRYKKLFLRIDKSIIDYFKKL